MSRPLRVFLCHSSNDKPAVRELYQKLRAEPWIQPWLDEEELYPGQDWNMEIEKAVEVADAIIVCLSKGSITKEGYVQRELRTVLDFADYKPEGTLYIIPVRLEECELPRSLRKWQYADYFKGQRERAFQRLLVSLKRRADALGLMNEELERKQIEEPIKHEAAKQAAREKEHREQMEQEAALVKANREAKKKAEREASQRKQREFINANSRWFGIGGMILLVLIFGGFGLNYLIKNFPVATATVFSPTDMATPEPPTFTSAPFTPTPQPTETPIPTPVLEFGSTEISPKDGMTLLYVPAGEFTMGEGSETHKVDLPAFWIDQTEVTNAMFKKCVDAGECTSPSDTNHFSNSSYANHPVVYVDWKQANAYCSWVDRRLPTEAEWEKAARSTDGRTYPWGEGIDCNKANYQSSCVGDTSPVGSYKSGKSLYGAYDMAGNVWEWVSSLYKPYPYDASDGREDMSSSDSRVLRGGSWYGSYNVARSADRNRVTPVNTYFNFGFRCARSLP
jgi:formylglycine-generating enzyme required for sulfatase activity